MNDPERSTFWPTVSPSILRSRTDGWLGVKWIMILLMVSYWIRPLPILSDVFLNGTDFQLQHEAAFNFCFSRRTDTKIG